MNMSEDEILRKLINVGRERLSELIYPSPLPEPILTSREIKILQLRFGIETEFHTLQEIATLFDVTRERMREIEAKATRKLIRKIKFEDTTEKLSEVSDE
jgi:DNA-directed RNA polymerase sigma subunit (sigma70/sigma32)